MDNLEMVVMDIVVGSGSARSYSMEAISLAKEDKFDEAYKSLETAHEEIAKAHLAQTDLIQGEARGDKVDVSLLMVHAQDHLMTGMVVMDLAQEFVDLYKKISEK